MGTNYSQILRLESFSFYPIFLLTTKELVKQTVLFSAEMKNLIHL
jgi:hypothetical protein